MSLDSVAMMSIKEKLLWSVSSREFSCMLKPAECAMLLKEVWDLEEPKGTIDRRLPEYDSERQRSCEHVWGAEAPDMDARKCTLCGFVQTNAERARLRYSDRLKPYDQGDPGDEQP